MSTPEARAITLQPISRENAMLFKEIRLRAMLDTPLAFGSTYARESQFTDAQWLERADQWSGRGDRPSAAYLALDGVAGCGIAAGFIDEHDPERAHLVSMWVAPGHRRMGVGRRLVEAIMEWARQQQARTVVLMVTSVNEGARRFYGGLGFTATGRIEPYPNDPALVEHEMARPLERG